MDRNDSNVVIVVSEKSGGTDENSGPSHQDGNASRPLIRVGGFGPRAYACTQFCIYLVAPKLATSRGVGRMRRCMARAGSTPPFLKFCKQNRVRFSNPQSQNAECRIVDHSFLTLLLYCITNVLFLCIKFYPWAMPCIAYSFNRSSHPCNDVVHVQTSCKAAG